MVKTRGLMGQKGTIEDEGWTRNDLHLLRTAHKGQASSRLASKYSVQVGLHVGEWGG